MPSFCAPLLNACGPTRVLGSSPQDVYRAATLGGAKGFGRGKELGVVAKGRIADLVAYRLDGIDFTPLNDPINQLVYSGRKAIDLVMVDGEVIMANGRLTRIDEDRLLDEVRAVHARLQPLLLAAEKEGAQFRVPFERIDRRCQHINIAPDTYPAHLSH